MKRLLMDKYWHTIERSICRIIIREIFSKKLGAILLVGTAKGDNDVENTYRALINRDPYIFRRS